MQIEGHNSRVKAIRYLKVMCYDNPPAIEYSSHRTNILVGTNNEFSRFILIAWINKILGNFDIDPTLSIDL